jgi:hypothetical protein
VVQLHGNARSEHTTADLEMPFWVAVVTPSKSSIGYRRRRIVAAARACRYCWSTSISLRTGTPSALFSSYLEEPEITEACFIVGGQDPRRTINLPHSRLLEYQHPDSMSANCGQHHEWWRPQIGSVASGQSVEQRQLELVTCGTP